MKIMKNWIYLSLIFSCLALGETGLYAQADKEALSFEDVREWRSHAVTLSDNGEWYTTLYRLLDKPESAKDSIQKKRSEQIAETYYQENNQTDVLYICHAKDGVKYKVPDGTKPIFSAASDWIAYQIKPEPEKSKDQKDTTLIELKHLASNFTIQYQSTAAFRFLEDENYFITTDENSLLVYDLDNRREHYIGNIGEYLVDRKSEYIAYTIASADKRGNGIYLFDPTKMTTRALQTGNFIYSNLSWNSSKTALSAYKYNKNKEQVDYENMSILLVTGIKSEQIESIEYPVREIKDLPENMGPAVKSGPYSNQITWSKNGQRLFLKIKKYKPKEEKKDQNAKDKEGESSVQIWHWKDKKLLSQRILEDEKKKNEVFDAIFFRTSNKLVELTSDEMQRLVYSKGTDNWAIGTDNSAYISDWDVDKNDLYSINLRTGNKQLIEKKYSSYYGSGIQIAPDGGKAILWNGEHYWCYDFKNASKFAITDGLDVSFVDKEYDQYGYIPTYGFVGWVKGQNAVIVNHKFDLWLLPLDKGAKAQNLTASVTSKDSIRFRFLDFNFAREPEIEDRYIDLSVPIILYAFNTQTKYAGYYKLQKGKLKELLYKPATFSSSRSRNQLIKSKKSDALIYKTGDYQNYPEAYLSTPDFKSSKKITHTNPQQEMFKWGKRILIDYTNDDGVPLQAVLSIPDDYKRGQKLPMIVHSYEQYSWRMYRYANPYLSGASIPEMLYVSDGYLFLQPDIHFNVGTPHSDMHECIDAAIEKVIELGYVDDARIGYEGFSFGGHCGMYISTQDNKFAAIAAGAGVSNLVQGFNIDIVWDGSNEQDYYMTSQGRLGTDPTSNIEMYVSESPVFNANTMDTPLLLFHGTADKVVQWEHSFGFYSILRFLKKPVVFLSYRGEGHGLRKESNRLDIQRRLKEYFDHYLKDGEAKKWMTEELPYISKKSKDGDKGTGTLPKWK